MKKTTKKKRKYTFKIQRGIPIPPPSTGQKDFYPFMKLKVGDSFFVPDSIRSHKKMAVTAHGRMAALRKAGIKIKIAIRYLPAEGGSRIWRIK